MPEIKQLNISDDIIPSLDQSLSAQTYSYVNGVLYVEAQDTQLYPVREFTFGRFHGVIFDVTYAYSGPSFRTVFAAPGGQLAVTVTVDDGGCAVICGWVGYTGTYGTANDSRTGDYRYVRISRNRLVVEGFTGTHDYIFIDVSHDKQTWERIAATGEMAEPSALDDSSWQVYTEFSGNLYLGPILGVDVPPYALAGAYDFRLRTPSGWESVATEQKPLMLRLPDSTWATLNSRDATLAGPKLYLRQNNNWLFVATTQQPAETQTVTLLGKVTLNGVVGGNDFLQLGPHHNVIRSTRTNVAGYRFYDIAVTSLPVDIPVLVESYAYAQPIYLGTAHFTEAGQEVVKNINFTDPYNSFTSGSAPRLTGLVNPYPTAWQATRTQGTTPGTDAGVTTGQQMSARATVTGATYTDTAGWIALPIAAFKQQAQHSQHFFPAFNGLEMKRINVYISLYGNSVPPGASTSDPDPGTSDVVTGANGRIYYQGPINSPAATWTWHDDDYPGDETRTIDSPYVAVTAKTFARETTGDLLYGGPLNNLAWQDDANGYARPDFTIRHELPLDFTGISALYHLNVDQATPGTSGLTNTMRAVFTVDFNYA